MKTIITRERCRKCGKWDRTGKWSKGINPPRCKCKNPDTLYKNIIKEPKKSRKHIIKEIINLIKQL